jgi:hypothetical protein
VNKGLRRTLIGVNVVEVEKAAQEVPVQEQPSININQLRKDNGLKPIPNGDSELITIR